MTQRATRAETLVQAPSDGVGFGEPPEPKVRKYDWATIAKRCRRRPNKWFKVFEQDKTTYTSAIRQGSIAALAPHKGFVMRTANNKANVKPRVCDLWVMYVPENDTTTEEK